jgi:hypothetical protein
MARKVQQQNLIRVSLSKLSPTKGREGQPGYIISNGVREEAPSRVDVVKRNWFSGSK